MVSHIFSPGFQNHTIDMNICKKNSYFYSHVFITVMHVVKISANLIANI